jgi:hypothetical protein
MGEQRVVSMVERWLSTSCRRLKRFESPGVLYIVIALPASAGLQLNYTATLLLRIHCDLIARIFCSVSTHVLAASWPL